MLASGGNVTEMMKLAIHCAAAATASATARILLLNISPSITQTTGPQEQPKNTTNRLNATTAIGPAPPRCGSPSTTGAVPKMIASVSRQTNWPAAPTSSSGLRPIRSTSAMAMIVVRMLVTEVITPVSSASCSVNPTDCQSTVE